MASKNFTGYLRDPLGEYATFDKWTFTHITTTGETVAGCTSILNIGADGFYNIDIEYGQVNIRTKDTLNKNTINQGTYVINSETLVTTLPALLNAEVPVSDPIILEMEAILADAEAAADAAEQSAEEAATSAAALNDIRYSKLDNPLTHIFKKNKLVDTLQGELTWTRASTATYVDMYGVVQTAVIDEPRQEKEGWLIEGASTNALMYSQVFDVQWVVTGSTSVTTDTTTAPDGTYTGSTFTSPLGGAPEHLLQTLPLTDTSQELNLSLYCKQSTSNSVAIRIFANGGTVKDSIVEFDFTTKSFSGEDAPTATYTELSDGWFRIEFYSTMNGTNTSVQSRIFIPSGDSGDVFIWGAQMEQLPFASSYIPTTDAAATRAADIEAVPYSENAPRGDQPFTFYFKGKIDGYTSFDRLFDTDTNNPGARIYAFMNSSGGIYFTNGNDSSTAITSSTVFGETFEYVITSDGVTYTSYLNGVEQGTAPVTSPATELPNELRVLRGSSTSFDSYGNCEEFRVYDFALNAAEVAFLAGE